MKYDISLFLLSLYIRYGEAARCLKGSYALQLEGECNTENFVASFKEAHERILMESRCPHSMEEEIDIHLGFDSTATTTERDVAVRNQICKKAWDSVVQIPFGDAAREEPDSFEQLFYNGGTYWNEEVETNLESTDGSHSNRLSEDAANAKYFYRSYAQTAQVQWPDDLTNFSPDSCSMNAAYCCWPKDRQANDNNGNCATPYDQNCFNKDPADNTDLCYNYAERGVNSTGHTGKSSMFYPRDNDDGEGAIHCHGFAWSNDPYDFTSRYKANNLFYVSMYDHLHQRGYAKETPGAPMCACAEQMPTATRSDCTQIDVEEEYKIKYSESAGYNAVLSYIEIDFNSCQGKNNRNNDLAAYVRRLVDEGKITADQRYALSEHLVENNNCPMAMKYHLESKHGLTTGYAVGDQWELIAGKDAFDFHSMGNGLFNTLYEEAPHKIFYRICATCAESHQHIYYKRLSAIPDGFDLFNTLKNSWSNTHNTKGTDFELYSTFQDAIDETNEWQFCNYNQHAGMPFECGPTQKVHNQWAKMLWPGGKQDVAIYILKNPARSFNKRPLNGGGDIGNPILEGDASEIDGKTYLTGAGNAIWGQEDQFYFLNRDTTGDINLKVHVHSLTGPQYSKVGLMIRSSLDKKAKNVACVFMSEQHGVVMQRRVANGDHTHYEIFNPETDSVWLQLEKLGDTYTCSWSLDGNDWTPQFTSTVDLGDNLKYGVALTSHDQYRLADAVLEDFSDELLTDNLVIAYEGIDESLKTDKAEEMFEELVEVIEENKDAAGTLGI